MTEIDFLARIEEPISLDRMMELLKEHERYWTKKIMAQVIKDVDEMPCKEPWHNNVEAKDCPEKTLRLKDIKQKLAKYAETIGK